MSRVADMRQLVRHPVELQQGSDAQYPQRQVGVSGRQVPPLAVPVAPLHHPAHKGAGQLGDLLVGLAVLCRRGLAPRLGLCVPQRPVRRGYHLGQVEVVQHVVIVATVNHVGAVL